LESAYKRLLSWVLDHRKSTVIIALALFAASMASIISLGAEFFPTMDEGQFNQRDSDDEVAITNSEEDDDDLMDFDWETAQKSNSSSMEKDEEEKVENIDDLLGGFLDRMNK